MDNEKPISEQTFWRLLAIGLDPDRSDPELYGLIYENAKDVPLMKEGRIVLFTDPGRARQLLHEFDVAGDADHIDVDRPFFRCDIAQTLYLLNAGGIDERAAILNAVNALLDLVRATGIEMPREHGPALRSIADYCTFNRDITKYLEEEGDFAGGDIIDAVLWCVGAIAVKSTVV